MSDLSIGVVIPAYQADIEDLNQYIEEIEKALSPEEIIVEYDEPENIEKLDDSVTLETFEERRGKGAAIRHGFNLLETDVLLFADSDGSAPPTALEKITEPIKEDEADLSVGSRRHPDTEAVFHQTYVRRFLGDLLAWTAKTVLEPSIYDYQCGAKAITREAWDEVGSSITNDGFGFDLELIVEVEKHGFHITEVPISWEDKPGSTVLVFKDSVSIGRTLLKLSKSGFLT